MFIGITDNNISIIVEHVGRVLANSYVIAVKTQHCHWNVEGPHFSELHKLFGDQYEEVSEAIDEIAERIRMLGRKVPASMRDFLDLSTLQDGAHPYDWQEMLHVLAKDHEEMVLQLRNTISSLKDTSDEATLDLMIGRIAAHEKHLWFLRSHLG
jgi:starvation-inducible DNA-binding protein